MLPLFYKTFAVEWWALGSYAGEIYFACLCGRRDG
jgi:hypothetical protein